MFFGKNFFQNFCAKQLDKSYEILKWVLKGENKGREKVCKQIGNSISWFFHIKTNTIFQGKEESVATDKQWIIK